jgi:hypothetical protein
MNTRKLSLITAVSAALLAPALSMAQNAPWSPANNNNGFSYQPTQAGSAAPGAQGRSAAMGAAVSPDTLIREGAPLDTFSAGSSARSAEQVRGEFRRLSATEKQSLQDVTRGN